MFIMNEYYELFLRYLDSVRAQHENFTTAIILWHNRTQLRS